MNVLVTQGSGSASVASELIGTTQYQQIKVVDGSTGSANKWLINSDGSAQVSILGIPTVQVTGSPSISGAVTVVGTPSISGTINIGTQPGSVIAFQGGAWSASVLTGDSSVITVARSSVASAIISGSVVSVPTGNQSISGTVGASVIGWVPIQPSNTSVLTIWQSPSIVGSYAEDAAHATGDKGIFMLGVRNDAMTSITSADGDYSPRASGPVGETITSNAPINKWVRGTADLRVVLGASVTAVPAQGASVFTYITSIQLANMGSASVLVTFAGGLGSILGYSIAPAGGGSNIIYPNALKTGENSAFTASISGTASVLVSAQGFTAGI